MAIMSPPAGTDLPAPIRTPTDLFPGANGSPFGKTTTTFLSMKWSALHDAAAVVSRLAGIAAEVRQAEVRNFPAIMSGAGGWRLEHANQGVDDLAAIMEPGLAALLMVQARGRPVGPAAKALWQEFCTARAALLTLIPPAELRRTT